jgi:hypothetical protein
MGAVDVWLPMRASMGYIEITMPAKKAMMTKTPLAYWAPTTPQKRPTSRSNTTINVSTS